jgi:hypothetical protein
VFQTIFEFLFKYRPLVFTEGRLTFQSPIGISLLIPVVALPARPRIATASYSRHCGRWRWRS